MKKILIILLALLSLSASAAKKKVVKPDVSVGNLRVENLTEPLGIDTDKPRFSWQIMSDKQIATPHSDQGSENVRQTAYEIVVSDDKGELWNSGKVTSDEQLWIPYAGKQLKSGTFCTWKVKVYTNKGETAWSEPQRFSIGLLDEGKWRGYWIGLEQLLPGEERGMHTRMAARYLRKEFQLKDKEIKRATAYVAGIGLHEFYVNGQRMGDGVLQPVPSDYRKTIYYNTYDVTESIINYPLMCEGAGKCLCLGIILGNGRVFPMQQHKPYKIHTFGYPKCRINVIVEYTDGTTECLKTDDKGWKITADGPIRANNEYDGEEYDARKEMMGWSEVGGIDDSKWLNAERTDIPQAWLRAQMTPGMRSLPLTPSNGRGDLTVSPSAKGVIVDIGQNMAGWLKVRVRGQKGDTIRMVYAEKLNADGTLYRDNFRNARSTDIYVCNGDEGKEGRWWCPTFVYHGFKYAEVIGLKNATKDDFVAEVVADEMRSTGQFECSDTILNKVMKNAWWGVLDNYKGMPIDCPQRDERQPWLGDRTMGSLGESFLFDNERLYTKWMRDICEAQRTDGCIPDVAPAFWNYYSDDVAWAAALPFSCDMLWRQYGNRQPIIDCYPAIKKWVQHIIEEYSKDGIIHCGKYADWCVPPEKLELIHSQDPARKTDVTLISTAYIIRTLQLMEQWGCEADYWRPIREEMTEAFNKRFLTIKRGTSPRPGHVLYPDSVYYGNNTVTANILPLAIGIVPEDCKQDVIRQVVQNICIQNKHHVSCGVIGISWLMRGLSDNGFADVAYRLATNKTYPSWGYMTENGATTIWELWNGDKANPSMNSGNHVMLLGDLLTWCYQYLGGIRSVGCSDTAANGTAYKHIVLKPAFEIQDCEWANVSYDSPYGTIKSHWRKTLQHLEWDVTIPCNTTADVCLPNGETKTIGSGTYHFSVDIPTSHPAIVKDEFLYEHACFPEAHASTIVETKNGDLVAGYFGGTHERDPDVCIWVNIKKKGSNEWSKPILAADGVLALDDPNARYMGLSGLNDDTTPAAKGPIRTVLGGSAAKLKRKSCWNPVLFEMPNGELWLFFKIGSSVGDWTGWLTKSKDGGRTWSDKEPLPFDAEGRAFLGPIKNKPELIDGRLLCPSSTEKDGWRFHMEILDLSDGRWKKGTPVKDLNWKWIPVESTEAIKTDDNKPHPIDCIQPSILKLKDGRLQVTMRTHNAHVATSFSSDNGDTWTPVTLLDIENNQSGTDAVTLQDGRHALIYNNFETLPLTPKGVRTPCSIALSDDGTNWQHVLTLEDSPIDQYSYPAIIQGKDGTLHCVYTWRRQRISYKQIDLTKLKRGQ
ncbi:MAG: alpha-rhamnosidase [Prevotella sp.]|jgi:alpha-L-rhamnosidase|nr:alpha-rhamnosidase [Prevotella sp.]